MCWSTSRWSGLIQKGHRHTVSRQHFVCTWSVCRPTLCGTFLTMPTSLLCSVRFYSRHWFVPFGWEERHIYWCGTHTHTPTATHTQHREGERERKRKYLWLFVLCFTPSAILYYAPYKSHMEGLLLIWHFWGLDLFCHNTLPMPKTHSVQIQLDNWIKTLKNWNWTWCSEGSWPTARATVQSNGLHSEGGNDRERGREREKERGG